MATVDALADISPPTDPDEGGSTRSLRERLKEAVDARDAETLTALLSPAAASGPLLTTITDMAGFFRVLSLASLMMPLLL